MAVATPRTEIDRIADKVFADQRITAEDALALFEHPNLPDLAALATHRRNQKTDPKTVTYVVGRILNYTNVCWVRCKFCAFYRVPNHAEGYTLTEEEILDKVSRHRRAGRHRDPLPGRAEPQAED